MAPLGRLPDAGQRRHLANMGTGVRVEVYLLDGTAEWAWRSASRTLGPLVWQTVLQLQGWGWVTVVRYEGGTTTKMRTRYGCHVPVTTYRITTMGKRALNLLGEGK